MKNILHGLGDTMLELRGHWGSLSYRDQMAWRIIGLVVLTAIIVILTVGDPDAATGLGR